MSIKRISDLRVSTRGVPSAGPTLRANWARVRGGTVTEYTKPDGTVMEVHTFTANSTLFIDSPGYADVLLVSGGTGGTSGTFTGGGGAWSQGLLALPSGSLAVVVGAAAAGGQGTEAAPGNVSSLGSYSTQRGTISSLMPSVVSSITGSPVTYCLAGQASPRANSGDGGVAATNQAGAAGVVIVAVQKSAQP